MKAKWLFGMVCLVVGITLGIGASYFSLNSISRKNLANSKTNALPVNRSLDSGQHDALSSKKTKGTNVISSTCEHVELRSKHFLYGVPMPVDGRYNISNSKELVGSSASSMPGISILVREGFCVGHADKYKVPVFVCMRWTKEDYLRSKSAHRPPRVFKADPELPDYAQAPPEYYYSKTKLDRGHMAPHVSNSAWGEDNIEAGNYMSNIMPQVDTLNRGLWKSLEEYSHKVFEGKKLDTNTIWISSGAIFPNDGPPEILENGVAVPTAAYKIVAWLNKDNQPQVRGYIFPQDATGKSVLDYQVSVDKIESLTGLDFFSKLEDSAESSVESQVANRIWN